MIKQVLKIQKKVQMSRDNYTIPTHIRDHIVDKLKTWGFERTSINNEFTCMKWYNILVEVFDEKGTIIKTDFKTPNEKEILIQHSKKSIKEIKKELCKITIQSIIKRIKGE